MTRILGRYVRPTSWYAELVSSQVHANVISVAYSRIVPLDTSTEIRWTLARFATVLDLDEVYFYRITEPILARGHDTKK